MAGTVGVEGMKPEDVYELVAASDPRVSPDGSLCAYVVTTIDRDESKYVSAIWMVATDGSSRPRRFTFGTRRDTTPRWAPDGTRLAFVSNRATEKAGQLYVIPIEGGEAVKLTDLKESVEEVAWSPDGTKIAFTARVRDEAYEESDDRKRAPRKITRLKYKLDSVGWVFDRPKHVFVVPADGSVEPKQLTDGDYQHVAPAWSPDGRDIAFAAARHRDWDIDLRGSDIYVMRSTGGRPRKLTKTDGGCGAPSWSPDGRRIAFNFTPGRTGTRHAQVVVLDVPRRTTEIVSASLDRHCAPYGATREPIWVGDQLLFAVEDQGNEGIYAVLADGSKAPRLIRGGEFRLAGYDYAGGVGIHVRTTPTSLPELYFRDRRLTNHGDAFVESRELIAPERFTAISADGSEVEAWIVRPTGFRRGRKYPVLVNIHGGPFTMYGNGFFDEFSVYSGAGYAVVYSNPRGSSGYAQDWGSAIDGPVYGGSGWGTVDYEDIMAVTEEAVRRFRFCDPNRVGVMGGSYGGYMTTWIVGHTDRFKAACSERAVNAWHSMHGSSDFGWPFKMFMGSFVFEDPDEWTRLSPITYAPHVRTPLLIVHSENDLRCPIEQAEQLFTTLRLLKRDAEFVRFPAESHELSRSGSPVHRVQRLELILDWFDRKLK